MSVSYIGPTLARVHLFDIGQLSVADINLTYELIAYVTPPAGKSDGGPPAAYSSAMR